MKPLGMSNDSAAELPELEMVEAIDQAQKDVPRTDELGSWRKTEKRGRRILLRATVNLTWFPSGSTQE